MTRGAGRIVKLLCAPLALLVLCDVHTHIYIYIGTHDRHLQVNTLNFWKSSEACDLFLFLDAGFSPGDA